MKKNFGQVLVILLLVLSLGTNTYLYTRVNDLESRVGTKNNTTVSTSTNHVDVTDDTVEIVKKVNRSVVTIEVFANGCNSSTGSGVVYEEDKDKYYIVTNHHVVNGGNQINVLFNDGNSVEAKLLGSDQYTDLAVLSIDKPDFEVAPIKIGDSNLLDVGETVLAIGSPLGSNFEGSTTKGIVSGTNRIVSVDLDEDGAEDWDMNVIQVDAAINPGNSGGALINLAGELVGITSMKISSTDGMGFAIPITEAMHTLTQLKNDGKVIRPVLGVQVIAMGGLTTAQRYYNRIESDSNEGMYIYSIQEGSAASRSDLKEGDIIIGFDGENITTYKSFLASLYSKSVGDTVILTVERDGKTKDIEVTLD